MKSNSIVRPVTRAVLAASVLAFAALGRAAEEDSRWVHPLCQPLSIDSNGPFVELVDGGLVTIDPEGVRISRDDGKTWSEPRKVCEGLDGLREGREPASSSILRTRMGALVIVYLDSTTYNFSWDNKINQPKDDCRLEIWAISIRASSCSMPRRFPAAPWWWPHSRRVKASESRSLNRIDPSVV